MDQLFAKFLCSSPLLRVLRSLVISPNPRHLRDIAKNNSLSVSGVSDILRRLKESGLIKDKKTGNKKVISLNLDKESLEWLQDLFVAYEKAFLAERSKRFSRYAIQRIEWMEASYRMFKEIKRR